MDGMDESYLDCYDHWSIGHAKSSPNQPNFLAKLNLSKTLLNPQPRPKGDIKSTLEAARQRRLAMEQRNSKEVEQVVMVVAVVMEVAVVMVIMVIMVMMVVMVAVVIIMAVASRPWKPWWLWWMILLTMMVAANKKKYFVRKLRRCRLETYYWWNR